MRVITNNVDVQALLLVAFSPLILSQDTSQTTPVPILKQINRVHEDGSYTYGYESGDGTYRIETRDNEGNVRGKYAYLDETGEFKTVEYAAGEPTQVKNGFEARGSHIHPLPKSAVHDPSDLINEEPQQPVKSRAKNLKTSSFGHNANNQPNQHERSPLSAFMSSDSDSWQSSPRHRFNAPKQRSVWDDLNAEDAINNNSPRRGFSFEIDALNAPTAKNHPVNKFNNQPNPSAFDVDFKSFPSSF